MSNRSSSAPTARSRAISALVRIEQQGSFASQAINTDGLDQRESRQLTEYVFGITRQRRWLDFIIGSFYHGEVEELEPKLRQILRLGLYEFLFLHTPPHAAVNEAVELAKSEVRRGAGGLVNGVLRAIQRQKDDLPMPSTGSVAEDLAIRHSHPTWIVERWLERYGQEDTEKYLIWNNERPAYGVRQNPRKMTPEQFRQELEQREIVWEPSPYLEDFVRIPRLQPILEAGWLEDGSVMVQDESAGLVVRMLDPQSGETVVDACAAPGGKALYAASLMNDEGKLLAFDIHQNRLNLVAQAAEQQGYTSISTSAADARELPDVLAQSPADRVLVDAPCSGLGVLTKRADLRWQRSPDDLDAMVRLQDDLLDAAAQCVRPGGLLVYSTCTTEPEENVKRVEAFLQRNAQFERASAPDGIPADLLNEKGDLETHPPRHEVDGAYAARLRRKQT